MFIAFFFGWGKFISSRVSRIDGEIKKKKKKLDVLFDLGVKKCTKIKKIKYVLQSCTSSGLRIVAYTFYHYYFIHVYIFYFFSLFYSTLILHSSHCIYIRQALTPLKKKILLFSPLLPFLLQTLQPSVH